MNGSDRIIKKAKRDLMKHIKQFTAPVKTEPLDKTEIFGADMPGHTTLSLEELADVLTIIGSDMAKAGTMLDPAAQPAGETTAKSSSWKPSLTGSMSVAGGSRLSSYGPAHK